MLSVPAFPIVTISLQRVWSLLGFGVLVLFQSVLFLGTSSGRTNYRAQQPLASFAFVYLYINLVFCYPYPREKKKRRRITSYFNLGNSKISMKVQVSLPEPLFDSVRSALPC
jgi:hypothetical protein